ncbi:protein kinase domain-containing protein [Kitasatospora camelliae]|uniref:Protein kinase n=1 Tax=Kitasatospora camelliae TaxID=3156397 RepID=A0AAU8K288_9ACTN
MGEVYLGRNPGGRTVAVKLVRGEFAADPEFRSRFRQEVAAARRVGGQWTAPVLDADTDGEQPWVATGYVAGPPLGAAVREHGPLPVPVVRALGLGLAEALEHVHGQGLVHRDIKPSNVLLAIDGPRLIDFGIARALDAATVLTQAGYVVGSPGFMSPEQAQGQPAGPPGDVFSLGAVLAYAATGVAPFGEGVSAAVLLYRVLHEQPDLGPVAPALRAVVEDCLAKDPADRPTPAELRERLAAGEGGTVRLGVRGWLPPVVAESVARIAVELLSLDSDAPDPTPEPSDEQADRAPADAVPTPTPTSPAAGGRPEAVVPSPTASGSAPGTPGPLVELTPPAPAAPAAARRRVRWAAGVAVAVAVAVTAGLVLWLGRGTDGDAEQGAAPVPPVSPQATPSPTQTPTPTPTPSPTPSMAGDLPVGFLGTWEGRVLKDGDAPSHVWIYRIKLSAGKVGDLVGRSSTTLESEGRTCPSVNKLLSAAADTLVVAEMGNGGSCSEQGIPQAMTFRLTPEGRLAVSQEGWVDAELTHE